MVERDLTSGADQSPPDSLDRGGFFPSKRADLMRALGRTPAEIAARAASCAEAEAAVPPVDQAEKLTRLSGPNSTGEGDLGRDFTAVGTSQQEYEGRMGRQAAWVQGEATQSYLDLGGSPAWEGLVNLEDFDRIIANPRLSQEFILPTLNSYLRGEDGRS